MFELAAFILDKNQQNLQKEIFQVSLRKQVQSRTSTIQLAAYWKDAKETFVSSSKKWVRKIKIIGAVKPYELTRNRKNWQRFLKTSVF